MLDMMIARPMQAVLRRQRHRKVMSWAHDTEPAANAFVNYMIAQVRSPPFRLASVPAEPASVSQANAELFEAVWTFMKAAGLAEGVLVPRRSS